jgi:DNA-binding MarR family transcriptional regulator
VERAADPADRRHTILRLTGEGRRVSAAMRRRTERHVAALLASLPGEARQQVRAALDALKNVLPPAP